MNIQSFRSNPLLSFLLFLALGFLVFELWLSGWYSLLQMILMTGVFSVCMSWIVFFLRMILGRRPAIDRSYIWKLALWITAIQGIIHMCIFIFAFYQNTLTPASLARIEISDGKKIVIFQQMSHIATDTFYRHIQEDITTYTESGYTVFYEGVGTGSSESSDTLSRALGMKFHSGTYESMARFIGMEEQDYSFLFSGVKEKSRLRNVDISLDEIATLYRDRSVSTGSVDTSPIDIEQELTTLMTTIRPEERRVMSYIVRSFMNFLLKDNEDMFLSGFKSDIMDIILDTRNTHIASALQDTSTNKIYALYGALHFEGILSELQKSNPLWKIVSIKEYKPYVDTDQ